MDRPPLSMGALCAGIGGLELGLEWAEVGHTAWQVELNEFGRRVLAHHWPRAQRYEDVKTVGAHNLRPVDLICAGFPCQDISVAGKQEGIREGNRSGLWYECARVVRELRPGLVVLENVPAIVAGGDVGIVLGSLAALGYDAEWEMLSAAEVGAPHLRVRWFCIAWDRAWAAQGAPTYAERDELRLERERRGQQRGEPRAPELGDDGAQKLVAHADCAGCEQRRRPESVRAQQPAAERSGETVAYSEGEPERSGLCPLCASAERGRRLGHGSGERERTTPVAGRDVASVLVEDAGTRSHTPGSDTERVLANPDSLEDGRLHAGRQDWTEEAEPAGNGQEFRGGESNLPDSPRRGQPVRGQPPGEAGLAVRSGARGGRSQWAVEPDVGRVAYGVPERVAQLSALGNAVVPQAAEVIGCRVVEIFEALRAGRAP